MSVPLLRSPERILNKALELFSNKGYEATSVRDSFLYEYFTDSLIPGVPPMLGVRTASWTYVTYPGLAQGDELYDLGRDPDELTNLADVAAQAGTRSEMRGQLERLLASTGGPPL